MGDVAEALKTLPGSDESARSAVFVANVDGPLAGNETERTGERIFSEGRRDSDDIAIFRDIRKMPFIDVRRASAHAFSQTIHDRATK